MKSESIPTARPRIGRLVLMEEKNHVGQATGAIVQLEIKNYKETTNCRKSDYFLTFVGTHMNAYWNSLSSKQPELRARLHGRSLADSVLPPVRSREKMYVLEGGRIFIGTIHSVVRTRENGGDWIVLFDESKEQYRYSVLSAQQAELEEKFEQQILKDEVQNAQAVSEQSRVSTAASA